MTLTYTTPFQIAHTLQGLQAATRNDAHHAYIAPRGHLARAFVYVTQAETRLEAQALGSSLSWLILGLGATVFES